jgi:hypothetical protein
MLRCRYLLTPPGHGTGKGDFFGCDMGKQDEGGRITLKGGLKTRGLEYRWKRDLVKR